MKAGSIEARSNEEKVVSNQSKTTLTRQMSRLEELEIYDRKQTTKKIVKVHAAAEIAQKAYK